LGLPTHFGEMLRRFIRRFGGGFRRRLKRPRSRLRLPVEARRHGAADALPSKSASAMDRSREPGAARPSSI